MLINRLGNNFFQLLHANDIRQKKVGNNKSKCKKCQMLGSNFNNFLGGPWSSCQLSLCRSISQNPELYFTEHHLHKIGLRTSPTAKQPTKCCGKQDNKKHKRNHGNPEDEKILGPENLSK